MKNKMQHVRDHLVQMMEALNDPEVSAETVARARALSDLAQTFTNTVKVEIEARELLGESMMPEALKVESTTPRLVHGGRA